MEKIKIAITGRVASVVALPEVVADNAEYEVDFALDPREGWDMALPITALFVRRDGSYTARILDAGKTSCTMPPQIGTNIVFVGLTQDDMRTTTPATIKVHQSIRTVAHDPLPAPSEDVYAQILAAYAGLKILSGKGAPTSATQGAVNQLYRDEDTQKLYICTATDGGYTWAAVSGGSVDVDATLTKAGYAADAKAAGDAINKKINAPQTAKVGDVLTVEEVNEDGKPTKWKTAPAAAEQKQADWAQNDETAAEYVKGRTHYSQKANGVILLETVLENPVHVVELEQIIFDGGRIKVYFDSSEYEYDVCYTGETVYIGNGNMINPQLDDTGEPFGISAYKKNALIKIDSDGTQHTMRIEGDYEKVHTLDDKYMPDTLTNISVTSYYDDYVKINEAEFTAVGFSDENDEASANEVVYDVKEKKFRIYTTIISFLGMILIGTDNAAEKMPENVGDLKTFVITDSKTIKIIREIGNNWGIARIWISFEKKNKLETFITKASDEKYTGLAYGANGYLYGITVTCVRNATSATVEVKRIL